ncbi:rhomboid family intramembrane serine protease [Candidatus Dojkabacteria bacterium]|uniref:Rhomboid family intramembrane serine protease n=1 Tax=Candidatus Dojkabacteria bacterium TaxID=2099670 RepID=A0A955I9R1_9BACT|nr:rhomboid family intramembrane serine protease [Candidatus Dojkabacteria bacterium]
MNLRELYLKLKLSFSAVTLLIVINVIFFLLSTIIGTFIGSTSALRLLGAEFVPDILRGQYWRFVLPAFLHAGIFHLILNMWALYHLGGAIETFYGHGKVLVVYVITGFFGSVLSVIATLSQVYFSQSNDGFSISVGSSAAVFGFVGLLIGNKFKKNTFSVSIDNYINTSQLWFFVGINILFGLGVNFMGSGFAINNFAHIGGFLAGIVLGIFLDLINTTYQSKPKILLEKLLYVFAAILVILSLIGQSIYVLTNIY